jgi:hypothetical protein
MEIRCDVRGAYNPERCVNVPIQSGIAPERWLLFNHLHCDRYQYTNTVNALVRSSEPLCNTYKCSRLTRFAIDAGIEPDNMLFPSRLNQSQSIPINQCATNDTDERVALLCGQTQPDTYNTLRSDRLPIAFGIDPEKWL